MSFFLINLERARLIVWCGGMVAHESNVRWVDWHSCCWFFLIASLSLFHAVECWSSDVYCPDKGEELCLSFWFKLNGLEDVCWRSGAAINTCCVLGSSVTIKVLHKIWGLNLCVCAGGTHSGSKTATVKSTVCRIDCLYAELKSKWGLCSLTGANVVVNPLCTTSQCSCPPTAITLGEIL